MASLNMRSTAQKPKAPRRALAPERTTAASGACGAAMMHREAAIMATRAPGLAHGRQWSGTKCRANTVAAMPKAA